MAWAKGGKGNMHEVSVNVRRARIRLDVRNSGLSMSDVGIDVKKQA